MKTPKHILKPPNPKHRSAEYALKISELRYRRLFETAQDGILILNADNGGIADVNPFLTDMPGYSRKHLIGWEIGPFKVYWTRAWRCCKSLSHRPRRRINCAKCQISQAHRNRMRRRKPMASPK